MIERPGYEKLTARAKKLKHGLHAQGLLVKNLKSRAETYRSLLETTSDLLWEVDRQWVLCSIGTNVRALWGYEPEEVIGKRIFDFMIPEDCLKLLKQFREIAVSRRVFQGLMSRFFHKDGRRVLLEISGAPVIDHRGHLSGYQGIIHDLTEHGKVEKIRSVFDDISRAVNSDIGLNELFGKIHESLNRLIDTTNFFIAIYEPEPNIIRFTYYTDQGDDIRTIAADDPGSITAEVIRTRQPLFLNQIQLQQRYASSSRPIGNIAKVWLGVPLKIKGKLIGVVAVQSYTDPHCYSEEDIALLEAVTEQIAIAIDRKQAEEALRESEEKYRDLVENIDDVIFTTDQNGMMTYISPAVQAVLSFTPEEIHGKPFVHLVPDEDIAAVKEDFKKLLAGHGEVREYRLLAKNGEIRWARISSRPMIRDGRFLGLRAVLSDVTESKNLQAQLLQAQRMEAIGTLAGGVAHDFNNILTGIQGRTSLVLADISLDHPHYEHLKSIEEYVRNAAGLTKQLLGFARGGKYEVKPINLNTLVEKSAALFGRTRKEIRIQHDFEPDLWPVEVDQTQIEQVLLNLFVNAWQAMPGGGAITLQTRNVNLDERFVKPHEVQSGRYVQVTVEDTGTGIPKKIQDRIFDPFFTTKEMGRGTGLGLASVYGIITNHSGIIQVYSEEGRGAEFRIFLPASHKKVRFEHQPIKSLVQGKETILLVDDETMILDVGVALLEKIGYKVFKAENGIKAVETFLMKQDQIDLVILDVVMPEMGGSEVFQRLRELRPTIKVLFSSGYSVKAMPGKIVRDPSSGFIQKPFSLDDLSFKVREILDRQA